MTRTPLIPYLGAAAIFIIVCYVVDDMRDNKEPIEPTATYSIEMPSEARMEVDEFVIPEELDRGTTQGQEYIKMYSSISDGREIQYWFPSLIYCDYTGKLSLDVCNIESNDVDMWVTVVDNTTGNILYESSKIPAGYSLKSVTFDNLPEEQGEYPVVLSFISIDESTGNSTRTDASIKFIYLGGSDDDLQSEQH